jgi:hypothetical protein
MMRFSSSFGRVWDYIDACATREPDDEVDTDWEDEQEQKRADAKLEAMEGRD